MTVSSRLRHRVRKVAFRSGAVGAAVLAVVTSAVTGPVQPVGATASRPATWTADLRSGRDDANVHNTPDGLTLRSTSGRDAHAASIGGDRARGALVTDPHELGGTVNRVDVELAADAPAGSEVLVDVRGLRDDGSWTEWIPARADAPARLEATVRTVQARVTLLAGDGGASPVVHTLRLVADVVATVRVGLGPQPRTYRVFATREGLVGGTTANGHVIRQRDHFVALPSRRGLSPRGTGDYTVKVCADNGRCAWTPVWDIGPWNTTDDYWNPSHIRQSWQDLAQGLPQAQAAYKNGHHGGRDQFGRVVTNPAGIDLADGTFWDGLRLQHNSWVTVSYLWTASGPIATVRAYLLNVRSGPTSEQRAVGLATQHAQLRVECAVAGERVSGGQGTTNRWLRIEPGQFVSAAHVATPARIIPC